MRRWWRAGFAGMVLLMLAGAPAAAAVPLASEHTGGLSVRVEVLPSPAATPAPAPAPTAEPAVPPTGRLPFTGTPDWLLLLWLAGAALLALGAAVRTLARRRGTPPPPAAAAVPA